MNTRHILVLVLVAFAVTLAVIVGQRLSSEAMAVVVGVIAGVGASIPTSLIVVWVASRSMAPRGTGVTHTRTHEAPAVVFIQPPPPPASHPAPPGYYASTGGYPIPYSTPAPQPRQFNVLGGLELEDE